MKHFLPLLSRDRRALFGVLSARVGSISDNTLGGWYSYRASKAALNMVVKNAAIEMARKYPQTIVAGLHPGTVDSALSKPFQSHVSSHKLFSPVQAAGFLLQVLEGLTPEHSGKCFAWDGQEVPA
jgi:NAD(P)-dependent dehydrogenase (short-subunit alcohol dehydrogenase family)